MAVPSNQKGLTGVLYEELKNAVNLMQKFLKKKGKYSSAGLYSSFNSSVEVNGLAYYCTITTTADYWDYVNLGVQGHGNGKGKAKKNNQAPRSPYKFKVGPPAKVFKTWIKQKPMRVPESAAYPMSKSAGRYGFKPTNYVDEAVNYLSSEAVSQRIANRVSNNIAQQLGELQ